MGREREGEKEADRWLDQGRMITWPKEADVSSPKSAFIQSKDIPSDTICVMSNGGAAIECGPMTDASVPCSNQLQPAAELSSMIACNQADTFRSATPFTKS